MAAAEIQFANFRQSMSDEDLAMFQRSLPIKSRENTAFGGSSSSDSSDEEFSQGRKIIDKSKADSKATGEVKTADVLGSPITP